MVFNGINNVWVIQKKNGWHKNNADNKNKKELNWMVMYGFLSNGEIIKVKIDVIAVRS